MWTYSANNERAKNAASGVGAGRISGSGIYNLTIKRVRFMKASDPAAKSTWLNFSALAEDGAGCYFNLWLTNKSGEPDSRAGQLDALLLIAKIQKVTTTTINENGKSFDVLTEFENTGVVVSTGIVCSHWTDENGDTGIDHEMTHFFLPDGRTPAEAMLGVTVENAKEKHAPLVDRHITKKAYKKKGAVVDSPFASSASFGGGASSGFGRVSSFEDDIPF